MLRILFLMILLISSVKAQIYYQPTNMSFESGEVGKLPPAWELNNAASKAGYEAFTDLSDPFSGKYHTTLQNLNEDINSESDTTVKSAAFYQRVDALSYKGYKIKFRAAIKNEFSGNKSTSYLFIEIKGNDESSTIIHADMDNPIIAEDWKYFEIAADVPADANHIRYGLLLKGGGTVKIDDTSIEVVQPEGSEIIPPKEISDKSVDNLYSLAKGYGYSRFFYPGEEVKSMNWDMFMIKAVEETENIEDSLSLANKLNELFKYAAPLSEINNRKINDKKFIEKPHNALDYYALGWLHSGGFAPRATEHIYSTVHNVYNSLRPREAAAFQVIDLSKYKNLNITVKADIKTENLSIGSGAMIWLRADNEVKRMTAFKSSRKHPGNYPEWTSVKAELEIPGNADILRIGAVFAGEGIAYFDNFEAIASNGDTIKLKNPGFENGKPGPLESGWLVPGSVNDAGYKVIVQNEVKSKDEMAIRISSSLDDKIAFPQPGKIFSLNLGNGLYMHMPSVLYADSTGVLPNLNKSFDYSTDYKKEGFFAVSEDRSSRLAIVIMAWSILDNFSLRNISDEKMYDILKESLKRAATDKSRKDFLKTIRNLIKYTRDSQARVWFENEHYTDALPILIEIIDKNLYVSKSHRNIRDEIKPGYEIIKINNEPAYEYLSELASEIPSGSTHWSFERAIAVFRSGELNSEVDFTFADFDGNQFDYTLKRSIDINALYPDRLPEVYEIDSTLLYLDITIINDRFIKKNINQIDRFDNIILDARGTADISEHTLGLFIDRPILSSKWEIPVYTFPDKSMISRKSIQGIIKDHNKLPDKNLVILTDERSIGYIEGILHIAKQYNIATIIGKPSAGMPGDVLAFRLPGNYNFSMTIMRAYAPDGDLITGKPVIPDINVKITRDDIINDIDPILKNGLDFFAE